MNCPFDGSPLTRASCHEPLYRCGNGHLFMAKPVYQEKFCLPIVNWCFGPETITCTLLGFPIGSMPEYACSGIKLGLTLVGVAGAIYLVKAVLGKARAKGEREAEIVVYD